MLRIDLDIPNKEKAIKHIVNRLSYMNDISFYSISRIESIVLIKKSSYGAYITLKKPLKNENNIVLFQLILGSDWRKEVNTLLNHHILGMKYSNRLFSVKRYKDGEIKVGNKIDITQLVKKRVLSKKRKKNFN